MQKPKNTLKFQEEVAKLLPLPISSISVQKKNTFRFSIFVEDQFLIGVSDSTLNKLNLFKGALLTPSLLDKIVDKENRWAIREYFLRLLALRDHAHNELKDKAKKKGYPSDSIEEILDELIGKGYINNLSFAKKFVRDKFEFNKWGPNKIRSELLKKGVSQKETIIALQEINSVDRIKAIENLLIKNKRKFERVDSSKRKKKMFDFLMRKGFQASEILPKIDLIK